MNQPLPRARLQALLHSMRGLRIGVLGDFTLDGYWHADMERSRLSRETPLYPRPVVEEHYSPGGAANVAWNLADIAVHQVWAFSVLGDDWRGVLLQGLLERGGIRTQQLLKQADRVTPLYGKVILQALGRSSQEDARLDFINTNSLARQTEQALVDGMARTFPGLDAWIVADYQEQGVMTPCVIARLLRLAEQHPAIPVIVDSRDRLAAYQSLILKPNEIEAARLFFPDSDPGTIGQDALAQAVCEHQERSGKPIFITRGAQGCLVGFNQQCAPVPGIPVAPPIDTVGAGDTFVAALAAALAAGAMPLEAAFVANLAASITIQKIGITGTASPVELLNQYDRWREQVSPEF